MKIEFERNKTSNVIVMYSLYLYLLYLLGSSLRNTSKALIIFKDNKRSHAYVWDWIQRFAVYPFTRGKNTGFYNR
jgi:putative transposase